MRDFEIKWSINMITLKFSDIDGAHPTSMAVQLDAENLALHGGYPVTQCEHLFTTPFLHISV